MIDETSNPMEHPMRAMKTLYGLMAIGLAVAWTAGTVVAAAAPPVAKKGGHVHSHPTEGPHHGVLIELGKEDYHAELVHDPAVDRVTIYVLDGAAQQPVPIDAKQLTLNLVVGGKPQQYQLAAQPQSSDPDGLSSAFCCASKPMSAALDAKGVKGRLNVKIGDKVFVGAIGDHTHHHPH